MRAFSDLYFALDSSTRSSAKQEALERYFRGASDEDVAWAAYFLSGQRLKRLVRVGLLRQWCRELAGIPDWLFDASYEAVGDLAETIALLLPEEDRGATPGLAQWLADYVVPLPASTPAQQRALVVEAWSRLDRRARLVHSKLLTGGFRVGVARQLVYRSLASALAIPVAAVAERLIGNWSPSAATIAQLRENAPGSGRGCRPYPFFLAYPLDLTLVALGRTDDWQAEWKWDGMRAQLVARDGDRQLWSRGEELLTHDFPEVVEAAAILPDGTVLDGELLVWPRTMPAPLPFAALQKRHGRKTTTRATRESCPVTMVAYDLLEHDGEDLRRQPLSARRTRLEHLLRPMPEDALRSGQQIRLSPRIEFADWSALERLRHEAHAQGAEGLMLKRRDSVYGIGRRRGQWWKWKADPHSVDGVLVYAQSGHGRRASLYTDYTFAVWAQGELVPFAKAYSGLSDGEIREVDRWIRQNTIEKFGPVRRVIPGLVFEIAFEGVQRSPRHRCGVAVRFPRIARWRRDKQPADADNLGTLRALLRTPP